MYRIYFHKIISSPPLIEQSLPYLKFNIIDIDLIRHCHSGRFLDTHYNASVMHNTQTLIRFNLYKLIITIIIQPISSWTLSTGLNMEIHSYQLISSWTLSTGLNMEIHSYQLISSWTLSTGSNMEIHSYQLKSSWTLSTGLNMEIHSYPHIA